VTLNIGQHKCQDGEVEPIEHPAEKGGGKGAPLDRAEGSEFLEEVHHARPVYAVS
jgi:hypothetical protein